MDLLKLIFMRVTDNYTRPGSQLWTPLQLPLHYYLIPIQQSLTGTLCRKQVIKEPPGLFLCFFDSRCSVFVKQELLSNNTGIFLTHLVFITQKNSHFLINCPLGNNGQLFWSYENRLTLCPISLFAGLLHPAANFFSDLLQHSAVHGPRRSKYDCFLGKILFRHWSYWHVIPPEFHEFSNK